MKNKNSMEELKTLPEETLKKIEKKLNLMLDSIRFERITRNLAECFKLRKTKVIYKLS